MPKVSVRRGHKTSVEEASEKARQLVDAFAESQAKRIKRIDWAADRLSAVAKGTGFTANFTVDVRYITVDVNLSLILTPLKGKISQTIEKWLDAAFGESK
jgi:hypothetical protein